MNNEHLLTLTSLLATTPAPGATYLYLRKVQIQRIPHGQRRVMGEGIRVWHDGSHQSMPFSLWQISPKVGIQFLFYLMTASEWPHR
jgi:hypothetical protein